MKLHIQSLVYGGAGLGREVDAAETAPPILVPGTLPGEVVTVSPPGRRDGAAEAELLHVEQASPERVSPRCSHFGTCGGCQLQHASYKEQLQLKTKLLQQMLLQVGVTDLPPVTQHSAEPWGYRNRIRLQILNKDSAWSAGYKRRGSEQSLPITECPIAAPSLWQAMQTLLALGPQDANAARWLSASEEVEWFTNAEGDRLQMTLLVRKSPPRGFAELCQQLQRELPSLQGAGVLQLPPQRGQSARRWEKTQPVAAWGASGLNYQVEDRSYWVSRGGFFQVNRYVLPAMLRLVTAGRTGTLAWDLYAGVGLFSRVLAEQFTTIVAVEGSPIAARDLAAGARKAAIRTVNATTEEFLRGAVLQRDRPELIVMDPPRAGLGAEVCSLLARLGTSQLVYVSCDPVTLARDVKQLCDSGYSMVELHLIDMFPQTYHQESMVVLERR
ncbi:MAG: 23S rRNA (uracil(1939)-C(5))-methyltransferase RlmD [Acidobacteriota bacterium]|nr:23S rRNA (uracil(1939)-C(5))-methyltransferase RlmD [Acidobacteriota bacterium]